jgi:hypothetical protein
MARKGSFPSESNSNGSVSKKQAVISALKAGKLTDLQIKSRFYTNQGFLDECKAEAGLKAKKS